MLSPGEDRTPPMTPQLALRVAVVGGIALVLFAVIFFRLWFLQILTGNQYARAAQANVTQSIPVAAQRGEIVDRNGTPLVQSVPVPAIQISPESLPAPVSYTLDNFVKQPAKDYRIIYDPLAKLLGMSTKPAPCSFEVFLGPGKDGKELPPKQYDPKLAEIPCLVAKGVVAAQYANVTIKTDVSTYIRDYLAERITQFPGVDAQHEVYVRKYPLGEAGAQVFGTLGQISATEVNTKQFSGVPAGSIVGQSGLEWEYNADLQGIEGKERVKVNSQNQFEGYAKSVAATPGDTLELSFDAELEKVAQHSLEESDAQHGGEGGAFVALNPDNGSVYAMGSAPSYDPEIFNGAHTISNKTYAFFQNPLNNQPLLNRAIQGVGADGSTFKVITATAALESRKWPLDETYDDNGKFCFPNTTPPECKQNSGGSVYGPVDLVTAIEKSVDTFFYNLGYQMNGDPKDYPKGFPLQQWAKQFGVGQKTGVDLPDEYSGSMSSPTDTAARWNEEMECETATGTYKGRHKNPAKLSSDGTEVLSGGCGIASSKYWTIGDNVNAAVGQGDDQLTPIQLAVVYAAIANGGTIVTPHLGMRIQSPTTGTTLKTIDPAPKRHLDIQPDYLQAIQQGLRDAATAGTSADVMGTFGEPVYGKTGTAQYINAEGQESDYAWYACYVPATATKKPIVVVVWVPKGGFGDVAATPVARQILSQWFYGKPGPFVSGNSSDQ